MGDELCTSIREKFLGRDWDTQALHEARQVLDHLEVCAACRAALGEFDDLRRVLISPDETPETPTHWQPLGEIPAALEARIRGRLRGGLGLAAALGVAAVGWFLYLAGLSGGSLSIPVAPPGPVAAIPPASLASVAWTPEEVTRGVRLFETVSEVYEGKARWVSLADGAEGVGLSAGPQQESGQVYLLRLVLWTGDRTVTRADIVILPGATADLILPVEGGATVQYKIALSEDPERLLSLWAEVARRDGPSAIVAALSTALADGGSRRGHLASGSENHRLELFFASAGRPEALP